MTMSTAHSLNGAAPSATEDRPSGQYDVAVVGAGLAGLVAATTAARAGRSVIVLEQASGPGGRARTRATDGFAFNIGPHALYRDMPGLGVLRDLGVEPQAAQPSPAGALLVKDGRSYPLPAGPLALLTSSLLGWRAKLEMATFFATLGKLDPQPLDGVTIQAWLGQAIRNPDARTMLEITLRTATYADDPMRVSAGAALRVLKRALSGALYVHGGWQTIVNDLRDRATAFGAQIESGTRVTAVGSGEDVQRVHLADGREIEAGSVVLAVPPQQAGTLVDGGRQAALTGWAQAAVPIRAAALDVGLRRLPRPKATFAVGFDRPLYYSVHSRWARLAPEGHALIHVLRYQGAAPANAQENERELEGMLDLLQPGWRDELVTRRYLPEITVSGALPSVAWEQTEGPHGPSVPESTGLFVAGDWVGPDGMLADRAIMSGQQAGQAAASRPALAHAAGRGAAVTFLADGAA